MFVTSNTNGMIYTLKDMKLNSVEEVLKELYYGAYLYIGEPIEQRPYNRPPKVYILFYDIDNNNCQNDIHGNFDEACCKGTYRTFRFLHQPAFIQHPYNSFNQIITDHKYNKACNNLNRKICSKI